MRLPFSKLRILRCKMNTLGVLVGLSLLLTANACKFPPHLWCSSTEIAIQCKVYDQCKRFVWSESTQASKVNFELYYESLCPDCKEFITKQLYPTYQAIGSVINITLVPYGNAEEQKRGDHYEFTCQHGKEECVGNLIETCAIYVLKSFDSYFPFINCMESSSSLPSRSAVTCAQQLSVPLDPIMACANGTQGNQLEHKMAVMTDALVPQHQYVPWVVLNGVHTEKINDEAVSDLLKLICDTYTGPKPSGCKSAKFSRCDA